MFGAQYYHGLIRKYVVAFGNLFDDLVLQRLDREGNRIQSIGVPLAYGPKEKFLQRLTQDPNLDSQVAITLPRMGFEINAFTYAPTRKLSSTHRHWAGINGVTDKLRSSYVPVPYDIGFTLSIFVANADDGAQLLEQIVPYFKPEYTTNVILIPDLGISVDTPFVLQDISLQDTYEGDFQTRRAFTFDLNFLCRGYLFGPISDQGIITQAITNYYDNTPPDQNFLQRLTYYSGGAILETALGDLETIDYDGVSDSAVAQNLWYVINSDSGNTYPKTPTAQLDILGGVDISTSINGNVLTIDYTGSSAGSYANLEVEYLTVENLRLQPLAGPNTEFITNIINILDETANNTTLATSLSIKTYVDETIKVANITSGFISNVAISNLVSPIATTDGGTGLTEFTENGVFYAANTITIRFASGLPGELLQIAANSTPYFSMIDGGLF